jgi:hypothetical protein
MRICFDETNIKWGFVLTKWIFIDDLFWRNEYSTRICFDEMNIQRGFVLTKWIFTENLFWRNNIHWGFLAEAINTTVLLLRFPILNAHYYCNCYCYFVLLSWRINFLSKNYTGWFRSLHTWGIYGICVCRCLDRQFPCHWIGRRGPVEWPPSSPDLTPLDFHLWGQLKAMMHQVEIQNIEHLKERITDVCAYITADVLKRVRHERERHIRMCYQCNGVHIEHVLYIKRPFSPCMETFQSRCVYVT